MFGDPKYTQNNAIKIYCSLDQFERLIYLFFSLWSNFPIPTQPPPSPLSFLCHITTLVRSGEYDYSYEFYLGPRHEVVEGKDKGAPGGYHSIVPMILDSGERVLVDRGWVQSRTDKPAGE